MSRPLRKQSHSGATSAAAGEAFQTKAHHHIGLFAVAANLDTANDTLDVRVEASPDRDEWATIDTKQSGVKETRLSLSVGDFEDVDGDGTFTAFIYASDVPVEHIRANITSFSDAASGDLSVDTYLTAAGNAAGSGHGFET